MAKYFYASIGIVVGLSLVFLLVVVQLDNALLKPSEAVSEPSLHRPLPAAEKQSARTAKPQRQSKPSPRAERPASDNKNPSPTASNLRLVGTSFWKKAAFAIIEDLSEGKQGSYRLGDTIKGFEITDISKMSVTLVKYGRNIILEVAKSDVSPPSQKLAWKIDDDHWGLSTEQITEKIRNIDQYAGQVAVSQHYENAKPAGFAIHHVAEGNDIETMGIEDGDIIKAVNGLAINDMTDVLRAVYELSDATEFQVEVERNNEIKTISYQLDASSNLLMPVLSNLFGVERDGEQ